MGLSWLNYLPKSIFKLPQGLVRKYSTKPSLKKKYGAIVSRATLENPSKPLVVILGWNDCKVKHLLKYSGLFEKRGWPTICLPAKSFNTFIRTDTKVKTISYYIFDLIRELTVKGNPVLFYTFSNGGCAVYFHIAEALTKPGQKFGAFKVAGSIFDSCPIKPNMESIPIVQTSVTGGIRNPILRPLVWHTLGFAMPLIIKGNPFLERFFKDLGNMPFSFPELFLYSKSDKVAPFEDITEHLNYRRSQGVEVFSKCWQDSPHVGHYMKYPEEYTEILENFLNVCFEKNN